MRFVCVGPGPYVEGASPRIAPSSDEGANRQMRESPLNEVMMILVRDQGVPMIFNKIIMISIHY
jgi:hypothetical protein